MFGWLFPSQKRDFKARRSINIGLRTLHLLGVSGFAGFFIFELPVEQWRPFAILAIISGALMVALELYVDAIWMIQLRGIAVMIKLLILCSLAIHPQYLLFWFALMVLVSGYFSHAPGRVRYYVPVLKRVIASSSDLRKD